MSRQICKHCGFIISDCICDSISAVENQTQIIVLQHKSEANHSKNTIRIAELIYNNITVVVGEKDCDFSVLTNLPHKTTAVLYPSEHAINIDNPHQLNLTHIIVLDGTWKKANKLLFSLDVLSKFIPVSFSSLPENKYHLRKANRKNSLSSLEAIAFALQNIENISMKNAYAALDKMMDNQFKHMPAEVRARYNKSD